MPNILEDIKTVSKIFSSSPTEAIQKMEWELPGLASGPQAAKAFLDQKAISTAALHAALNIKDKFGQINVVIHALGVLIALPYILEEGEQVHSVALGAGNTGLDFDLETDRRIAEFKFITWRGGAEVIRQNSVFKDFLKLLWDASEKRRQLYLTGTEEALSFLRGGRALSSVLSRNVGLKDKFQEKYGARYRTVGEFYRDHQGLVEIVDMWDLLPQLEGISTFDDLEGQGDREQQEAGVDS